MDEKEKEEKKRLKEEKKSLKDREKAVKKEEKKKEKDARRSAKDNEGATDIVVKSDDAPAGEKKRSKAAKTAIFGGVAATAIAIGYVGGYMGARGVYNAAFGRCEKRDSAEIYGLYDYSRVAGTLPREEMIFNSRYAGKDGYERLKGYYYKTSATSPKGLVVICHGIHAGADDYLPMTIYFAGAGFNVFSFDYKGTYGSTGDSTVGMSESLVDLDNALDFIKGDSRFFGQPVFLVGHSWGGFAVAAALNLHPEVKAAASIAGFDNAYTLIEEKGLQYAGEIATEGLPRYFLRTYQKELFGDYVKYTASGGINAAGVPVVVAHGRRDKTISFAYQSVISKRDNITNPNVVYYIGEGKNDGHNEIWHAPESVDYKREIDEKIKKAAKNADESQKIKLLAEVDHELYSRVNGELFDLIADTFTSSVE